MEERLCAFIDILGFSNVIDNIDKGHLDADFIESAFKNLDLISQAYINLSHNIDTHVFSDTIVGTKKVTSNFLDDFQKILNFSQGIQALLFFEHGLLTRGALTIGKIKHDGNILFGMPIVCGHDLESKEAIYPRIVIEQKLISYFKELGGWFAEEVICRNIDEYFYLNPKVFFNLWVDKSYLFYKQQGHDFPKETLKQVFLRHYKPESLDHKAQAKWAWLHNELFGEPL